MAISILLLLAALLSGLVAATLFAGCITHRHRRMAEALHPRVSRLRSLMIKFDHWREQIQP